MASGTYQASPTNAAPIAFPLDNGYMSVNDPTGVGVNGSNVSSNISNSFGMQSYMSVAPYQGAKASAANAASAVGVAGWAGGEGPRDIDLE